MAYTYDFMDNVTYGTDDVNKMRSTLMTKGVIPESATSCKVIANGSGRIKIQPGEAVFANGVRIEITSEETLSYTSGSTNYVYFEYSSTLNKCEPKVSTSSPASDRIKLATISSTGAITDTREVSNLKVPMGVNSFEEVTVSISNFSFASSSAMVWELASEVPVKSSGYKNFVAKRGDYWTAHGSVGTDDGSNSFVYNSGKDAFDFYDPAVIDTYTISLVGYRIFIKFVMAGRNIQVWLKRETTGFTRSISQTFTLKLS